MEQLSTYLPTLSNVVGVCWFNQVATVDGYGSVDYSVNTSAASLASWDQDFVNNPAYQGALPGPKVAPDLVTNFEDIQHGVGAEPHYKFRPIVERSWQPC